MASPYRAKPGLRTKNGSLSRPLPSIQNSPVLKPNLLDTIRYIVRRVRRNGVELAKQKRVSVYEALKAAMVRAACQYGEEICKGKPAYLAILVHKPKTLRVLETIKEGQTVYRCEA